MSNIVVDLDNSISRHLMSLGGEAPFYTRQLTHGDWGVPPLTKGTFAKDGKDGETDFDKRNLWMRTLSPETPAYDAASLQGWTYVADYSVHPYTPNNFSHGPFYIHARITSDNRLQFGVFERVVQQSGQRDIPLALLDGKGVAKQLNHGTQEPALRIAPKEEAERFMLLDGKLRCSRCPKFAGIWMNYGVAKIALHYTTIWHINGNSQQYPDDKPGTSLIWYYGHIWSYWYTIVNNTLYFIGVPIYTDDSPGSIVYTYKGERTKEGWVYSTRRALAMLPPTWDDLRISGFSHQRVRDPHYISLPENKFRTYAFLVWDAGGNMYGFKNDDVRLGYLMRAISVNDQRSGEEITLCSVALAKIDRGKDGNFSVKQLSHGEQYRNLSTMGIQGGMFRGENGVVWVGKYEADFVSEDIEPTSAMTGGVSGYVPSRTRSWYNLGNSSVFMAQAFYVLAYGNAYNIEARGAFRPYSCPSEHTELQDYDEGYEVEFHYYGRTGIEPGEDLPPEPPKPGPDPFPGPGEEDDDDDDDDDDTHKHIYSPVDLGDLGYWYEGGGGVVVSRKRDRSDMSTLLYEYEITIKTAVRVSDKLLYRVTLDATVADGGSYPVQGDSVTMWYGLSYRPTTITVTNVTSKRQTASGWEPVEHPPSSVTAGQTVYRNAYAHSFFDSIIIDSKTLLGSGNVISVYHTGRTKTVRGSIKENARAKRRPAKGKLQVLSIVVHTAVIKQILQNYLITHAEDAPCGVYPASVRGSVNGAMAGDPVVTAGDCRAECIHSKTTTGATHATGPIDMFVEGMYGRMEAEFSVASGLQGWYERTPDNRQSGTISGTFTVEGDAKHFIDGPV